MNFLHFNDDKTEVTLSGPTDSSTVPVDLGLLSQHLTPVATNLGVRLDSNLKFDAQVSSVVKSSFYQLRRLTKAKPFLSLHHFEIWIHAFITTCSWLLQCTLFWASLAGLQLVQNAAARLLTGTKPREHITPVLASLHWLPIRFLLAVKCLHGLAPQYVPDLLQPYAPSRSVRSADRLLLVVPKTKRKLRGDRAFSVTAPKLWDELPLHTRQAGWLT